MDKEFFGIGRTTAFGILILVATVVLIISGHIPKIVTLGDWINLVLTVFIPLVLGNKAKDIVKMIGDARKNKEDKG